MPSRYRAEPSASATGSLSLSFHSDETLSRRVVVVRPAASSVVIDDKFQYSDVCRLGTTPDLVLEPEIVGGEELRAAAAVHRRRLELGGARVEHARLVGLVEMAVRRLRWSGDQQRRRCHGGGKSEGRQARHVVPYVAFLILKVNINFSAPGTFPGKPGISPATPR